MNTKSHIQPLRVFLILAIIVLPATLLSAFPAQSMSVSGVAGTITHPGFLPKALALDETRNRLFVFDQSTGSIFIYNATTFAELGSIPTTLGNSISMVVDESQGKLYAGYFGSGVSGSNWIAVINTSNGTLLKYLPSGGYTQLVKDEELDTVYASSIQGISKINATTDVQTSITGISGNIYTSMAVNQATHELFVANWSQNNGNLFIVNPATLAVKPVPGMNGFGVAVNWSENKAYITYCPNAGFEGVCIYDRDNNSKKFIHTYNDSSNPLVFNPSVNRMYSNTEVNAVATVFNGSTNAFKNVTMPSGLVTVGVRYSTDNVYYINASGTYVMKGASGKIIAEFPAGASCSVCSSAMVINQTSGLVYVINETAAGSVTVIQDDVFTSSLTVASTALEDGWILESSETSGSGKSMNSIATTLRLGDDAANKQYRSILSFHTSSLPDNAEIALVTLKFKYAGKTGTLPFGTHGNLLADVSNGAFSTDPNLQPGDFKAPASKSKVLVFTKNKVDNWYSQSFSLGDFQYINLTGVTQFRLRFAKDDNNDFGADFLKIYSGETVVADQPQLIIEYILP